MPAWRFLPFGWTLRRDSAASRRCGGAIIASGHRRLPLPWEREGLVGLALGSAPLPDPLAFLDSEPPLGATAPPRPAPELPSIEDGRVSEGFEATRTAHVKRKQRRREQGAWRSKEELKRPRVLYQRVDLVESGGARRGRIKVRCGDALER